MVGRSELSGLQLIQVLARVRIEFIVIGGVAAEFHGLAIPATIDIDITPSMDKKNLLRLASAFDYLDAGLVTADQAGTWFPRLPVENWAQYDMLHLVTRIGLLDIVFFPAGARDGYSSLISDAFDAKVQGIAFNVITIKQWEHLKRSTGRAKDRRHLRLHRESEGSA